MKIPREFTACYDSHLACGSDYRYFVVCLLLPSTKIDIMVLYSSDSLTKAGVTDVEMKSMIKDAIGESNDAFRNSDIDLTVKLVHTQQVSDM